MDNNKTGVPSADLMYSTGQDSLEKRRVKEKQEQKEQQKRQEQRKKGLEQLTGVITESTVIQAVLKKKRNIREDIIKNICTLDDEDPNFDRKLANYARDLRHAQREITEWEQYTSSS